MRRALVVAAGLVVVLAAVVARRDTLWRAAYPHLPARVQALPYRVAALGPAARRTPVAMPTVAAAPVTLRPPRNPTPPRSASEPVAPPPATALALPPAARVAGVRHVYQRWNNCGPATVAMALSAAGDTVDQMTAAQALKPDPDDKNVGPLELAAYARSRGLDAIARVNGDHPRLRALVAAGLPVIVETWFIPKPGDEMGHYRLVTGYSDGGAVYHTADSYEGPAVDLAADDLDRLWRVFNRAYLVVFPPARRADVESLIGADMADRAMYLSAYERAVTELARAEDAYGWFNVGASLVGLGDMHSAAGAFDRARALGLPWRMLWYQAAPFEAYAAAGRWDDVRSLAEANLRNADNLEESLYWRGRARAAQGDSEGARADFRKAVALHPGYAAAEAALRDTR